MDRIEKIIEDCRASINKEDLESLVPILQRHEVKVVLEIGTWRGFSIELWHQVFKPEMLITVENDLDSLSILNNRVLRGELSYMDPAAIQVVGDSTAPQTVAEVKGLLGDKKVDFLFIDGDHHYESVKQDFFNYGDFLAEDAIVLFHDVCLDVQPEVEVHYYWKEIKKDYSYLEVRSPNSTGVGLIFL